jgi:flagellar protein FlaH
MEVEEETPIISTGNVDINGKLGGGIPVGSLMLIEGQSASGKSVLTQQLTWGSLWTQHRVTLYTTERTIRGYVRQMDSLGLDVLDFLLLGRLKIFPVHKVSGPDASRVFSILIDDIERRDNHDLIIVDSLTPMVTETSVGQVISFFERCRALCSLGKTIVVTLHSYSADESTRDRVRSMCDANIHLRVDQVADQLVNVMEVAKISGASRTTGNVLSFAVEPGIGLRIIPVSWTKV